MPVGERLAAERRAMEAVNRGQAAFYDRAGGTAVSDAKGAVSNLWRRARLRAYGAVSAEARRGIDRVHAGWAGDLRGLKVLELGAGEGRVFSRHLARGAATYHAIDLSDVRLAVLRRRLRGVRSAAFFVGDVLSDGFGEGGYDLIYAHSVLHHFRHLDAALARLEGKLAPGGRMVTYDPLQTWWPARAARALHRPFQTDSAWEFPFDRAAMAAIERRFEVLDRVGLFGRAKWAMALGLVAPEAARRRGDRLLREDYEGRYGRARTERCLVVSYHLRRRGGGAAAC